MSRRQIYRAFSLRERGSVWDNKLMRYPSRLHRKHVDIYNMLCAVYAYTYVLDCRIVLQQFYNLVVSFVSI